MAKEVERKFLVSRSDWRAVAEPGIAIVQFYIASTAERSVRIRIRRDSEATLTIKFGGDKRIRDEVSFLINNLCSSRFRYTKQSAKEVCVYVIDNDLARKYSA